MRTKKANGLVEPKHNPQVDSSDNNLLTSVATETLQQSNVTFQQQEKANALTASQSLLQQPEPPAVEEATPQSTIQKIIESKSALRVFVSDIYYAIRELCNSLRKKFKTKIITSQSMLWSIEKKSDCSALDTFFIFGTDNKNFKHVVGTDFFSMYKPETVEKIFNEFSTAGLLEKQLYERGRWGMVLYLPFARQHCGLLNSYFRNQRATAYSTAESAIDRLHNENVKDSDDPISRVEFGELLKKDIFPKVGIKYPKKPKKKTNENKDIQANDIKGTSYKQNELREIKHDNNKIEFYSTGNIPLDNDIKHYIRNVFYDDGSNSVYDKCKIDKQQASDAINKGKSKYNYATVYDADGITVLYMIDMTSIKNKLEKI